VDAEVVEYAAAEAGKIINLGFDNEVLPFPACELRTPQRDLKILGKATSGGDSLIP
jgi:hypothetical protein